WRSKVSTETSKGTRLTMAELPNRIATALDKGYCRFSKHIKCRPDNAMSNVISRTCLALAIIGLSLALSGCGYNTIPTLQEQAKASWSDVQNQYQRRADLIPNLVSTVQGYAAQEKSVLTGVIEARAKATQIKVDASDLTDPSKIKAFQGAQNQLTGALARLLSVSEKYPDLKSHANFLTLQSQLEHTEYGIAV